MDAAPPRFSNGHNAILPWASHGPRLGLHGREYGAAAPGRLTGWTRPLNPPCMRSF